MLLAFLVLAPALRLGFLGDVARPVLTEREIIGRRLSGIYWGCTTLDLPIRGAKVHRLVDEAQLLQGRNRKHERVGIRKAETPIEIVEHIGQR